MRNYLPQVERSCYDGSVPRPSPVSDEVGRLFASGERHAWSLGELLDGVRRRVAGANYSSVFRAVGALEQAGVVDRLDLGDGTSRYELKDGHHEHVRCESCGRVAEVRDCAVDDAKARIQAATGFAVSGHHVVFVGLCPVCSQESRPAEHMRHPSHPHRHGPGCGHIAVRHGDHTDYMHGGHRHAAHADHWDEH
jgi:Fe2+ or Zn2+ uptake regulation protein